MDKNQLKRHIQKSDLTALEKRYLEEIVDAQHKTDGRRLIDADKLEKDLMDMAHNELMPDYFRQICMSMAERVSKEPTIEAEPVKHGRCISDIYGTTCSACGSDLYKSRINFCPNCGAKMKGE